MIEWRSSLDRTYALIVGVEEYDEPDWPPLTGVARNAVALTKWLLARGVPGANIILLTSSHDPLDLPLEVPCRRPTWQEVRQALFSLGAAEGHLLWLHWAGHGYFVDNAQRLLLADANADWQCNVKVDDIIARLGSSKVPKLPRQLIHIDACQLQNQDLQREETLPSGDDSQCIQEVLVAAEPRFAAVHRDEVGGLFTQALLEVLPRGDHAQWPPDPAALAGRIRASIKRLAEVTASPPMTFSRNKSQEIISGGPPPRVLTDLGAYAIPRGWRAGELNRGLSADASLRLDMLWGLDRAPGHGVVSEPPTADLAYDLDQMERLLERHAVAPVSPRRRWFSVQAADFAAVGTTEPARWNTVGEDWPRYAEPAAEQVPGFVVTVDVRYRQTVSSFPVVRCVEGIRARFPSASILVAVRSPRPAAGITSALRLAGELSQLPGFADSWSAVTRMRPGRLYQPSEGTADPPPAALACLVAHLTAESREYGIDLSLSPPPGADAMTMPADVSAGRLVTAVVAEMEATDGYDDLSLLCAVRDLAEQWYEPLLHRYAEKRSGRGWPVSLALATFFPEDLRGWRQAARREPSETDLPLGFDAGIVRAFRSGWSNVDGSPAVTGDPAELLSDEYWARIRQAPLSAEFIMTITGLPAHRAYLAAIPGVSALAPDVEPIIADRIAELRRQFKYVPGASEEALT